MAELPPYAELLKVQVDESGEESLLTIGFHEDLVGRPGYLHGGAIAGLLEIAAFHALAKAIGDPSVAMKPVTVTVDYLRPAAEHDTFAAAIVHRLGSKVANVEAFAWQLQRNQPVATARLNFLLDRPPQA